MRKLFLALSIIILMIVLYLAAINFNNIADINILSGANLAKISISANIAIYTICILIAGLLVGAGIVYMFLDATNERVKIYQRELEKTSISGTNSASKVEVLEAKIKTLEKAFNTVIDERTKLEMQIKDLNTTLDKLNKEN